MKLNVVRLIVLLLFLAFRVHAAETIPPAPERYFNDYAQIVSAATASRLNEQLADFERQTSNQIVVAIYPKLQTDSSLDDYCYRVFHAWKVGQAKKNNGAVLFVFVQDHKMRIQTGYGLEGALPDATCKQIIENELVPRFRQNNFEGGLTAGVNAMIAATRGEYKGTGRTVRENQQGRGGGNNSAGAIPVIFFLVVIIFMIINAARQRRRGMIYGSGGPTWYSGGGPSFWGGGFSGGGGGGGGWSSGGGDSGGGSSGFSGGGGDSGGGGASGSW